MCTDILGGVLMGYQTILTLTGATHREDLIDYPYRPHRIIESIADMIPLLQEQAADVDSNHDPMRGKSFAGLEETAITFNKAEP